MIIRGLWSSYGDGGLSGGEPRKNECLREIESEEDVHAPLASGMHLLLYYRADSPSCAGHVGLLAALCCLNVGEADRT
jgi:hypothetical protein